MKKIIAILLAAVLMVSCLAACGGGGKSGKRASTSSYEDALDLYFKCLTGDASKAEYKKTKPEQHWTYIERENEGTLEESYQDMLENAEEIMDEAEYKVGSNAKVTYKVVDKKKWSNDELEEYRENFDETAEELDVDLSGQKLQIIYSLELEVTLKGSEGEETYDATAEVLQYDGNWFVTEFRG